MLPDQLNRIELKLDQVIDRMDIQNQRITASEVQIQSIQARIDSLRSLLQGGLGIAITVVSGIVMAIYSLLTTPKQ